MASAEGGFRATDGNPEAGMGIMERPPEDRGRVGSKRVRDPFNDKGSHGFLGVTTSEKKAAIASGGTSKIGVNYLHGTHGEQMLPDSNMLRSSISCPDENMGHKFKWPNQVCTLYAQGRCKKGNSCALHEIGGPGSDYRWNNEENACLLETAAYGNPKGTEEGSVQRLSNFKVPQFKDAIAANADKNKSVRGVDKKSYTSGLSHEMSSRVDETLTNKCTTPINDQVYENNQEPSRGYHSGLTHGTYLSGRGTFPRLLDGGILQSAADKRAYLEVNNSDLKYGYRSFDLHIPSDPLQNSDKFPAYGGTAENLPRVDNLSSCAPYTSYSLPDFRNPLYGTSDHSFSSPTFRTTSHLGRLSHHQSAHVMEKVGCYKNDDVGTCTSRPALLPSSPRQPSIVSPGSLSPIKDEVWITSVPFVPSIDLPDIKTPPRSQYDPFVDYIDTPKDGSTNILKSPSISDQHTNSYGVIPKSLNHDNKVATAKGSTEIARLSVRSKGDSSSLDNKIVQYHDRKASAASSSDKTRNLRFRLVEHVKKLIEPIWLEGYLSKDAYKLVVKKSLDKILSKIEPDQVPTSEEAISYYITIFGSKIEGLVKAYVDKHRNT